MSALRGRWLYPYRSLRLSRDGWFFLVVTMAIGFAALNTGHNLFYLVFAMQVSLIVVSGLLSERAVRGLGVERILPRDVFAREAAPVELRVQARGRRRSVFTVEVRDVAEGQPRRRVGFVDRLDPGALRSFHSVWSFPSRGRRRFGAVHLVTRFPFGLFEKTRIIPLDQELLVYPAIGPMDARAAALDPTRSAVRKHRLGEELIGLRRKLHDDDPRHIHWRVSARVGELMVKDPGQGLDQPLTIFFDNRGPKGAGFEAAVERAATLLWQLTRAGRDVNFYSYDFARRRVGRDSWHDPLAYLAEVEPSAPVSLDNFERWLGEVSAGGAGVFVTAGEPPALPPGTLQSTVSQAQAVGR